VIDVSDNELDGKKIDIRQVRFKIYFYFEGFVSGRARDIFAGESWVPMPLIQSEHELFSSRARPPLSHIILYIYIYKYIYINFIYTYLYIYKIYRICIYIIYTFTKTLLILQKDNIKTLFPNHFICLFSCTHFIYNTYHIFIKSYPI